MRALLALLVTGLMLMPLSAGAAPDGQLTIAAHVSLAPAWFDPAETPGVITPFLTLYALHDAPGSRSCQQSPGTHICRRTKT